MTGLLLATYLAAAGVIAVYAFRYGVVERPRDRLLAGTHYLLLAGVAAAVGALWIIFVPSLTIRWLRAWRSQSTSAGRGWAGVSRARAAAHS